MAETRLTVLVDSAPGATAVARAFPDTERFSRIRVFHKCSRSAADAEKLLVFSAASKLDGVVECVSIANKAHRLAALLVYSDVDPNWLPYVFHQSGLRALRNMIVHSDPELPTRILSAWAMGGEHDFFADAAVIKDRLVVRSCAFEEYSVSFDAFPALQSIPDSARTSFVFEDDGFQLCWPDFGVHLDLDDVRFANDPRRKREARIALISEQRAIGAILKHLREHAGLTQSDIKGISERQVRRVESGERMTVDTLDAFAAAMGVEPNSLLEQLGELIEDGSWDLEPPEVVAWPERPEAATINEKDDQPSSDRRRPGVRPTQRSAPSGENLQLAAASSPAPTKRSWSLLAPRGGSVRGSLDYDFRTDQLVFVIDDIRDTNSEALRVSALLQTPEGEEPFISDSFVPHVGARILIASGRAIVPSDVSDIKLTAAYES